MPDLPYSILQVIPDLDTGGAELTAVEVAEAVVAAGGRALIATRGGRLADRATAAGAKILIRDVATKNPLAMWRNAHWMRALIRDEGVHLVHARSRAPAWSAESAARRAGVPFVTTYHGAYSERGPLKRAYNAVMARGDTVIANSAYTCDLIVTRYGLAKERIAIIDRGVDVDAFDGIAVTMERARAMRASWNVDPDAFVVLHPARLTRWKGQPTVIEAMARLREPDDRAVAILAGDAQGRNAYQDELAQAIASAGVGDRVRLVGHVSDMAAAYASADVVLIASTEPEAFGRTSAEAQAMGVPVIATNIGAPRDTVVAHPPAAEDQITGWLVPPGDPEALAAAIKAVRSMDDAQRQAMRQRAIQRARTLYSTATLQRATLDVYRKLLAGAPTIEAEDAFLE